MAIVRSFTTGGGAGTGSTTGGGSSARGFSRRVSSGLDFPAFTSSRRGEGPRTGAGSAVRSSAEGLLAGVAL